MPGLSQVKAQKVASPIDQERGGFRLEKPGSLMCLFFPCTISGEILCRERRVPKRKRTWGRQTAISFVRRALVIVIISGRVAMPLTPTEIIGNGRSSSEKGRCCHRPIFQHFLNHGCVRETRRAIASTFSAKANGPCFLLAREKGDRSSVTMVNGFTESGQPAAG